MTASRLPTVIDALIAAITTALATAGTEDGLPVPIEVLDGPRRDSAFPTESVVVGDNGDESEDINAANSDRAWIGFGARKQDENGEITCAVIVQSGDVDFKPLRLRAYVILDLIETALRADPTIAGGTGSPGWALITEAPLRQSLLAQGAAARVVFTVAYRSRI